MTSSETSSPRPPLRLWPAALILVLTAVALVYIWFVKESNNTQDQVVATMPVAFFATVALVLWVLLFSRLPGKTRLVLFGGLVAVLALGVGLFRVGGVSGNLVPILTPRFGGGPDFAAAAPGSAGVTNPGPHDYPQFLGPRRDGRLQGPRLHRDWSAQPPREVWRHDVGEGWSSFAVVGSAAITHELRGDQETVVRYELETGQTVWTHAYEAPFRTTIGGNGPRATPTVADGLVYALGATGVLSCLDLDDGRLVWSRDTLEDAGAKMPSWGKTSSPLVAGGVVIVQPGAEGRSLAGYDRLTGEILWHAGEDRGSYGSPVLATVTGVPQVLILNQTSMSGHDPETGAVLWSQDWPGGEPKVTAPLVLGDDRILFSAGYGLGSRMLALEADGDGSLAVQELWASPRLKSKFANMVLYEGTVYGLDDGILTALDPETGERRWKRGRYGHGQIILVGDLLLIQTEKGDVVLAEANPDEHVELGRLEALSEKTWNPPALAGRYLLVRNHREAACYELPVGIAAADLSSHNMGYDSTL